MSDTLVQASRETHFEVHVLRGGRWMIEATSKDQQQAMADAKDLVKRSEVRAIKVFKETTNNDLGRSAAISIFSHVKREQRKGPRPGAMAQSRTAMSANQRPSGKVEPTRSRGKARPAASEGNPAIIAIAATAIVMGMAAALYLFTVAGSEPEPVQEPSAQGREKPLWLSRPLQ